MSDSQSGSHREQGNQSCCPPGACGPLSRREFVALASVSLGSLALGNAQNAFAGPFDAGSGAAHPVPVDKKLTPAWVAALAARGEPEIYSGEALKHVGMPIGGIGCGQLYLGGDGRLWHWDIFQGLQSPVDGMFGTGPHYAEPLKPVAPLKQGFAIQIRDGEKTTVRTLDAAGFRDISFRGEYPIGRVTYQDADSSVSAALEAFSPFIPLNADDSALPATIMSYTLRNTGPRAVEVDIAGWIENICCPGVEDGDLGQRINRIESNQQGTTLVAEVRAKPKPATQRADIVLANFEGDDYAGWKADGPAFGTKPFQMAERTKYNMLTGTTGCGFANSHNSRTLPEKERGTVPGTNKTNDLHGTLRSPPFKIERKYIRFQIAGGRYPGKLGVRLYVDGKVVRDVTGDFSYNLLVKWIFVSPLQGKQAELEIYDEMNASWWGFVAVDQIVQSDNLPEGYTLDTFPGYGSLALSVLGGEGRLAAVDVTGELSAAVVFKQLEPPEKAAPLVKDFPATPVGAVGRSMKLKPGESQTVTFVLAWSFPHYKHGAAYLGGITDLEKLHRRHFAKHATAADVAAYIAANFDRLAGETRLWNKTWYDSTLPYWFLDRTFIPLSTLATQTCHWFDNGRFYGWEGVYCCAGTCQHVWQYAQGMARIFPQLERSLREMVDFGIAYKPTGELGYRGEHGQHIAHDGQLGTVLRFYREHQMSADGEMLKRLWPRVRQALSFVMDQDKDGDGLLEGAQYNTLDATWYGPMGWISSLYLAAVEAGEAMACETGDEAFAKRCAATLDKGRHSLVDKLYNGEYFYHIPDAAHPDAINTNDGCHIDQLFGQSYAWQLGLPRVAPPERTLSALRALWKYNFAPDAGVYRQEITKTIKGGRWYAMPGEAGLLMCTWPRGGAAKAPGKGADATFVGYFNECMTGFEYQAASHMIWEGMTQEGLAVVRAIHDRYAAAKRNPYNEIECSDHYARAMAGYGAFLAACGYEYHGPEGRLTFAPRWQAEKFRTTFTAAEGWGTFFQDRGDKEQTGRVAIAWGKLRLTSMGLTVPAAWPVRTARASLDGKDIAVALEQTGARVHCRFKEPLTIKAGQALSVTLGR